MEEKITLVVAATQNKHKIDEIGVILNQFHMKIISQGEVGLPPVDVEETGSTFEENSKIKAQAIMKLCKKICIADDSGLMVEALGGAPGVYSARFSGLEASDESNNEKLLTLMEPEENRRAKFVSVITMIYPDGRVLSAKGECHGIILKTPRGEAGFGYDPLFVPDGQQRSFGEMSGEEKNKLSHRAKALAALMEMLERV